MMATTDEPEPLQILHTEKNEIAEMNLEEAGASSRVAVLVVPSRVPSLTNMLSCLARA